MARIQLGILAAAALASVAGGGVGVTWVELKALLTSKGEPVFVVNVEVNDDPVTRADVVDDAGKLRRFKDADDFFKAAGALGLSLAGAEIIVSNLAVFDPKPFTGDIVKKNTSIMNAYAKRKVAVDERITGLTQQITLSGNTPGVPQSVVDELTAQKASCVDLSAWLAAEIARIDAIVNPPVGP